VANSAARPRRCGINRQDAKAQSGDNLELIAKRSHKVIVVLAVQKILDEHIAKKPV
jgi:hypothetical protein